MTINTDQAEKSAISFFEKNLTYWVALCMVIGVLIGNSSRRSQHFSQVRVRKCVDSDRDSDLVDDLSDDDESRFCQREKRR